MQVGKRMMEFDFNPRSPHGKRREAAAALRRGAEFQSTLPARGATRHCNPADAPQPEIFQPTLPARGATVGADVLFHPAFRISIHAPRTGSDTGSASAWAQTAQFQSTLPARGATPSGQPEYASPQISIHAPRTGSDTSGMGRSMNSRIISIHAPRTGSDGEIDAQGNFIAISIHAPRTGSDAQSCAIMKRLLVISIHAPRTGSDSIRVCGYKNPEDFNPRSPHGERLDGLNAETAGFYFNPRSPHGERLTRRWHKWRGKHISIHAPRTGSDPQRSAGIRIPANFNPRSPHGERPALLRWRRWRRWRRGFQPTLPARGATQRRALLKYEQAFQSTLPARGATHRFKICMEMHCISIHAPRTGSDPRSCPLRRGRGDFNPRSPHGERHFLFQLCILPDQFQSTLPAQGATTASRPAQV